MHELTLDTVSLDYGTGNQPVLDRVALKLRQDEFVVVIGRSGAGKTSLLNLAAGFVEPTEGRVLLDGKPVSGPGQGRVVVFQDDALFPWLDALDNVAFPLKLERVGLAQRRAEARRLLSLVGLARAANRRIWELSGGMRQRVGIARALAAKPAFLLLDEPLGALDALTRSQMQELLLDVWAKSWVGALLVTHSIEEALLLGTRILVLAPGGRGIRAEFRPDFGRRLLAGESAGTLKDLPEFLALKRDLVALIEDGERTELAA